MNSARDPYETLGVDRAADDDTIRAAYRVRARQAHPDVGGGAAAMAELNAARALLLDKRRRAAFDSTGQDPGSADPDAKIFSMIVQWTQQCLDVKGDVPNPVSDMRRTCTAEIERLKLQKLEAEAVLRRARQMAGAYTGGIAARVMAGAIDEVLCRKAADIEACNAQIAHFKRARDLLGEVVYQPPEPPPAEPTATFSGFFIGASS